MPHSSTNLPEDLDSAIARTKKREHDAALIFNLFSDVEDPPEASLLL